MVAIPSQIRCSHNFFDHLFKDPLCKDQSTRSKVAVLAFHFFTAFIPLAIYHAVKGAISFASRFKSETLTAKELAAIQQKVIPQLFAPRSSEAVAFARGQLTLKTKPIHYSKEFKPVNREIPYLVGLLADFEDNFVDLLKKHKVDPWKQPEVIEAADKALKVAYAVSALTLADLPFFVAKVARENKKGDQMDTVKALISTNFFQFRTFFALPKLYHDIRGEAKWRVDRQRGEGLNVHLGPSTPEFRDHYAPFYQEGTIQARWRELYNEFCHLVPHYVSRDALDVKTHQYSRWTKPDTEPKFFHSRPDTLPWL